MNQMNRSSTLRGGRLALLTLGALWLGLSAASCAPTEDVAQEELGEQEAGICASGAKWPAGFVDVCWNTAADKAHTYASVVEQVAQESWSRAADIRFNGWGVCPAAGSARFGKLVMEIAPTSTSTIGTTVGSGYPGASASSFVSFNSNRSDFAGTVRHLFGRVLGFDYETGCTTPSSTCSYQGNYAYDPASIMGSCKSSYGELSTVDVLGAQKIYGRKANFSLVGLGGRCLNILGGSTSSGASLVNWDCISTGTNDKWGYARNMTNYTTDPLLRAYINSYPSGYDLCANISGGNPSSSGTNLITWPCLPAANNEHFKFEGVKWVLDGDRCVQAYGGGLRVALCSAADTDWDFLPDRRIRASQTNTCVQAGALFSNLSASATMATCLTPGSTNFDIQQFDFSGGLVENLDLRDNYSGSNIHVYLQPSYGYPNAVGAGLSFKQISGYPVPRQLFHISGPIHAINNLGSFSSPYCMDVAGGNYANGTQVTSYPCTGGSNQTWQYYH